MTKKSPNLKNEEKTLPVLLTQEQISTLNEAECRLALEQLEETFPLDEPLNQCFVKVWDQLDDIVNTLLWLEDRIKEIQVVEQMTKIRAVRTEKELNTQSV